MTFYNWIQRRENGLRPKIGDGDFIYKYVYNAFEPYTNWASMYNGKEIGAVFNLEFSPEGTILVAACEKKSIMLFDPITTKQTKVIYNAHNDNVNCIKFLDNRMFATCSDDTTVALWDTRNLKQKIRSLQGHSNWVKNIEYSQKDRLLVTSGFDGTIYTWDINSFTEQGFIYQKVFHTSGLMRCRISPDATKLIICTTGGYLILIHDLDLTTLAKDLCGFRPNIYRLMQLGRQFIPQAAKFDHIFSKTQKRNRVELISDFPEQNDAEVVSALQVHPEGWCVLSRNISYDESSEWTCIHNIQEKEEINDISSEKGNKKKTLEKQRRSNKNSNSMSDIERPSNSRDLTETNTANRNEAFVPDIWAAELTVQERACRSNRSPHNSNANTFAYVYAISSGVIAQSRVRNDLDSRSDSSSGDSIIRSNEDLMREGPRSIYMSFYNRRKYQNIKRLLYYIKERNEGKGYIKEPSFSSDGRIICSPYGTGVRLLGFSDNCSEMSSMLNSPNKNPLQLYELKKLKSLHSDIVVSTKFSPKHPLLVTGCLKGNIVWYHPDF